MKVMLIIGPGVTMRLSMLMSRPFDSALMTPGFIRTKGTLSTILNATKTL
jgi:hypothetical protein